MPSKDQSEVLSTEIKFVDQKLIHERELRELENGYHEKALRLAAENTELRLHNLNEWKQAAISERQNFVTRESSTADVKTINATLAGLEAKVNIGLGIILAIQFFIIAGLAILQMIKKT